jgi:hypothetical protein
MDKNIWLSIKHRCSHARFAKKQENKKKIWGVPKSPGPDGLAQLQ